VGKRGGGKYLEGVLNALDPKSKGLLKVAGMIEGLKIDLFDSRKKEGSTESNETTGLQTDNSRELKEEGSI